MLLSYVAFGLFVVVASGAGIANDIGGELGALFLLCIVVLGCLSDT